MSMSQQEIALEILKLGKGSTNSASLLAEAYVNILKTIQSAADNENDFSEINEN